MKNGLITLFSRIVLSLAACLSFFLPVHAQTADPTQGIILYADRDYGGASWSVGEGTFGTVELDASGVGNNRASSLRVAPGYQVQLCDGPTNDCVAFSNSIARLGSNLDNRVSNLIVGKTSFGAMQAEVGTLARHVRGETNLSEQALQDLRDRIVNDVSYGAAGRDRDLVARAYETVQSYESIHGPLFTDEGTKTFRREDSLTDGRALERVMQTVYLIAFDGVNAANLAAAQRFIGGMVFRSHEYFPGAVPKPTDPNAVYQMRIDASVPEDWGRPNLYSIVPARRPTGAYVAPGTIGEVTVPASLVNKGYQIRVGAHSWNLAGRPNQRRLARVSNLFPITSTTTKFANPMGGNVYIEVPYLANAGLVQVQFKNTIRAPFYSQRHFHKMSPTAWAVEKTHPGPFADMESERSMLSIPSKWVRGDYDVVAVLKEEDDMADSMSQFMGKPEIRNKTVTFRQVDVDFRSAAFAPGYPMSDFPNFDLDEASSRFQPRDIPNVTIMHEMGHGTLALFFKNESEAIVHMPMVLLLNKIRGMSLQRAFSKSVHVSLGDHVTPTDAFNSWALTDSFLAGEDASNRQLAYNYAGIGNYMDIVELFGWEALIATNRDINQHWVEFGDAIPRIFNEHGVDDRILRLSRATGVDIRPIIHVWGKQPIDQQALAADLQAEGLLPSAKVYDRLIQHQRHIPENQGEFDHFWSQIGADVAFYPEWTALRNNYDPARGNAAANRINQLIALYFPNGRPQGIDDAITIYQDDGFTGIRANLGIGTHNFVDLEASGVGNDDISSIRVGNGYTVFACAHTSDDSCRTYSASTATLGELDNSISSIEVRRSLGTQTRATVYSDTNLGGSNVDLAEGIYTLSDLVALRIGNDAISSIQVSDGYTVYACASRATDGTCRNFSGSALTLGQLNNQISYIEVGRSNVTEPTVTVYGNTNYGGTNVDLAVGAYTLKELESLGIANDSISSIRLYDGFSAYACQHGSGGGVCRTYTESTTALGLLDNSISYIEVVNNPR